MVSDDARLRSLTADEGYLMPAFDPATLAYTVNVPRGSEHVTLTAVPADERATVAIDGMPGEGPLAVDVPSSGIRMIPIQVTAQSGAQATTTVLVLPELVDLTTYVKASNTEAFDRFGAAVAVSGDTLAVGAPYEDSVNGGVNTDGLDNDATDSGAVYVYVKENGTWRREAFIKAAYPDSFDEFGYSVALSGDTLVVGAPGDDGSIGGIDGDETAGGADSSGAVYVFTRAAGVWTQGAYLKAASPLSVEFLGTSVAIEGDTLVAGAPGHRVTLADDELVTEAGMVTVFVRNEVFWAEQAELLSSRPSTNSDFGMDLGLSGDTLVVGAFRESSDASGVNAPETGMGATSSGAAYVFVRSGTSWSQQAFLKASDAAAGDYFGLSVAIAGERLVVGAPWRSQRGADPGTGIEQCGAAYVFARDGASWFEQTTLTAANAAADHHFGGRVAMDGELIAVGAADETGSGSGPSADPGRTGAYSSGAVYLFKPDVFTPDKRGFWYEAEYIKAPNSDPNDDFGISVALADGKLAVGASGESSSATGVNGDELDDSATASGAAYVFELNE